MKLTLVILAAGMASRYGSMKQVESFGPGGETIMDYSIYDAIRAGFGKIVFIIREQHQETFRSLFAPRLAGKVAVEYVNQELFMHTEGYPFLSSRNKPWGTAHAVLCAGDVVREPFAVINADDFYGRHAFEVAASFLKEACRPNRFAIVGYPLSGTLSAHGSVNRGVCSIDSFGKLVSVTERINIASRDGKILVEDGLLPKELLPDTRVSMNFWCFDPAYFPLAQELFSVFLQTQGQLEKSEFFIPLVADSFIQKHGEIEVIPTEAHWFGVTYKEDAPAVQSSLNALIQQGEYPERLWSTQG
ncbi:MAG: nucleotidyltransferase [Bacteroidetes bacterium]|nr:nucleotidyltransferase [Bacteroidota bacterium]